MLMLILGVSLWSLAHLFKRLMPAMRERMHMATAGCGAQTAAPR